MKTENLTSLCIRLISPIILFAVRFACGEAAPQAGMTRTPADCVFIENGKAVNLTDDRVETGGAKSGKWTRLDGWLQSHESANTLFAGKSLAQGDFHVSARLAIDDLEIADVFLHVPEAIGALRFRDENGNISISGRVTGKGRAVVMAKTADHIQPGKSFLFEMIRKGEKIFLLIDGKLIFDRQWPRDSMGLFGFIARSGSLRISDFRATGALDEIPSQDQLPQIPVFMGVEDNPDGSYPIKFLRFRIPSLLIAPNGDLLAFAEARHEGASDAGNIDLAMKRSHDGGRTWGKSQLVYEEGGKNEVTIGNPCPVVDEETGVIWMAFCRNNRHVFVTSSADNGDTWAKPTEITKDVQRGWGWYATGPGVGIQLKRGEHKGRLVIPCNHKPSHVFYSDDHGKSWKLGGNAAKGTDESQVAELVDGSLMLNCRSGARREVFLSKDGGESFEKYSTQELVLGGCQASLLRYSNEEDGGKNRLLFSNPNSRHWRVNLTVRLSYDEGKTWSVSKVIDPGSAQYSCLVVLPDGDIGVLYEDAGKSMLTYTRFSLDWLTNGKDK